MDSNEPGHAIPFITFVAKKGFVLTKEAEEFLHSLAESHIGVISVVGKYRTGKSFFINRVLLDTKKNGFNVGPTINPCTKGLWLWSKTLKSNNPEHENMKVILIDTEGFGGMDENSNHDTRIFLFALLLSSFFIYNSAGSIDETALQNLSLIVNLAKEIQVSSGGNNNEDVSQYFPSFLWVVRDFALKLLDPNGDPISSKEYLENALNPQKGVSDAVEAKNRTRRLLKHFFRDRDCCTMVRPLENEQELQKLDGMSNDQLRPEFVDQIFEVKNKIFRRIKPKALNGRSLTGSMLVEITKAYIDGINSGKVPNIENAWTYVCKEESQKAMSEAIRLLDERLGKQASSGPLTSAEMKEFKNQAKEEVYQQFKKKSMGDSEELQELHEELNNQIHQRFTAFKQKNVEKWNHTLMEWISVHSNLGENLKEDKYKSYFEFKVEFDKLQQKFEKEAPTGMNKDQAWKEYSQQIFALAAECISRKAEDFNNGQQRIMTQRLELLEKELSTKKKDYETEKEQLYHQIHQFERERGYARAQENSTKDAIDNLRVQKEKYEKLYNETIERGRNREDKIESEGKAKISDLETKLEKMRSETLSKTVDLEKRNALLEQEMVFVRRENDEIKKKCEALENEKRELILTLRQKESYIEECKKEVAQAQFGKTQDINQLKIELERKINDLSNDENKKKEDLKQYHDWQMERFSMENQIQYLTIQLDETKKLHKELLTAIENGRTGNESEGNYELVQTNKNLSAAMENMEVRCKLFEEKVEKLKKYKRMIRNATALQCSHCSKFISCSIFPQHMKNCINAAQPSPISNPNLIKTITPTTQWQSNGASSNGIVIEPYSLRVAINQTAVKESTDSKPYTEFMIQVSFNATKWTIAKQYKNFCELHHSLSTQFPNLKLPESALAILGSFSNANYAPNTKRPDIIEERRKSLEHYLKELIKIDVVRNSAILQKFLVIDQVSKVSNNTTVNPLITQRLNLTSYRDDSKRMESTINSRQNVDDELLASDLCSSIGPRQDMTSRLQDTPQSIFSITSPKNKFERTLPPTSPKSFLTGWTEKPLSKENTMPRSRGTSEDATSKGVRHHLVKDSYRPQHTQLKLNDLTSGRYLSDTPNKLLQDLMASNAADSRTQRSMLENHRGHVSNKSWVSNGQATERILLVQQAEGSSLNKSHTKGSKSIGRIRPSSRNLDDNSHFSGSLNTSTKINHSNTSYHHYQTLTRDQRNY